MIDLALDETSGDLLLTSGDLTLVKKIDAVKQYAANRLLMYLGEYFLDVEEGLPWFEQLLRKNVSPILIDSILKTYIIDTPGIVQLAEFDFDFDRVTRKLYVTFSAIGLDGEFELGVEL